MGEWLHGAWALYSVLAWAGKSKRLNRQASPLHMSLWSWEWMGSRHEGSWSHSSLCVCCFLKPRDSEWWCWCPWGRGRLREEHISPSPPGIPGRQGEPPLVHSWLAIASRLSSGFGSGHCVTCPLPVSLKMFISWLIWKILHGYKTWSQNAGQFFTCSWDCLCLHLSCRSLLILRSISTYLHFITRCPQAHRRVVCLKDCKRRLGRKIQILEF